jgi:hypothetical protein
MKTNRFFVILLLWSGILSAQSGTIPAPSVELPTIGSVKYASNTPKMTYFTVENGDGIYEIMAIDAQNADLSVVQYSLPFTHPLSKFWIEGENGFLLEMKEEESILRIYKIDANGSLTFLALKRLPVARDMQMDNHQMCINHGEYFSFYSLENATSPTFIENLTAAAITRKALGTDRTEVYPNPSSESWTLDLRKLPKSTYSVCIVDISGKNVMNVTAENEVVFIENPQTAGLYFYTVSEKNGTFISKGKLMSK